MLRLHALLAPACLLALLPGMRDPLPSSATAADFDRVIRANDLTALRRLVLTPAAADGEDKLHSRPLHYAAIYGSVDSVRILLEAGADPNARDLQGATPLIYAAWNCEKTRLLVEKGAAVNAASKTGVTPLMVASSVQGNIAAVRYLIAHHADVRATDQVGSDALVLAGLKSDAEVEQFLLQNGADPRHADKAGFTALHNSLAYSDFTGAKLLLAAGSDPNAANSFGGEVKNGPLALVHLTPLMLAVPHSQSQIVERLLQDGAHPNDLDIRKMTPLMLSIATDQANPEIVRRLIASGADVNAKDRYGESVLDWAQKFRNPEILSALHAAGAQGSAFLAPPQPPSNSQAANPSEAVKRALPLLCKSGPMFFREGGGCAGCHHQPLYGRVSAAVKARGTLPDSSLRQNFLDAMLAIRPRLRPDLPLLNGPGGDFDSLLAPIMAYADLEEPANDFTDVMVHYVALRQSQSGAWELKGIARPPIEDGDITRTAMAIRALKQYGWPARQAEFSQRIERARNWLTNAVPVTTYEHADRITGLRAAGVPASELRSDAQTLIGLQHADGGWAQTRYLDSDSYATGLVLHSLYTAGLLKPNDAVYSKGVAFLMRTQFPDGSWYVRSRAPKFQPYFQSGFPFDHDQWISSAGTAWALMALAPAS